MGKDIEILKAKLEELRKSSTNENEITKTLLEIGSVYRNEGNYQEVLKYYQQSLEICRQNRPPN